MKFLFFILAAIFFLTAVLQFNDPDPVYWIAVYAGTGLVLLCKGIGRSSEFWSAVALGAVLAGMIWSAPGFLNYLQSGYWGTIFADMQGSSEIEYSREFLGLAIALASLVFARKG